MHKRKEDRKDGGWDLDLYFAIVAPPRHRRHPLTGSHPRQTLSSLPHPLSPSPPSPTFFTENRRRRSRIAKKQPRVRIYCGYCNVDERAPRNSAHLYDSRTRIHVRTHRDTSTLNGYCTHSSQGDKDVRIFRATNVGGGAGYQKKSSSSLRRIAGINFSRVSWMALYGLMLARKIDSVQQ